MAEKDTHCDDNFVATREITYVGMDNETRDLKSCLDDITVDQECMNVAEPVIILQANIERELCKSDDEPDTTLTPEIGRDLCREEKDEMEYGGYRKNILTENLTERDEAVLICINCKGIMKEACISSGGEQFCLCCEDRYPSKQTPNLSVRKMINSLKCSCPLIERGCKWLGTLGSCENHLDTCCYVREMCKLKCGVVLRRDELEIHMKDKCPKRKVKCIHCNKDFKSCKLDGHFVKCLKMEVSCVLCGTNITREDISEHLKFDCGMVQTTCELGCGVELTRYELKIHVKDKCPQRKLKCQHCNMDCKFCELSEHLDKCPKMNVSCDLKCGKVMCREDMKQHLKYDCGMVQVTCDPGCGVELTRDELKIHVKDTCLQREIRCEHCFSSVKFRDNTLHLKECPYVKVPCYLCGAKNCRKDITEHLEESCPEKTIKCPFFKYKCLARIKRKDIDKHLEENETKHLGSKLTALEDLITKQSEQIDKQNQNIESLNKIIKKMWTKETNTSLQMDLLYTIIDATVLIWAIKNVTDIMSGLHSSESEQHHEAGYTFVFKFRPNRAISIVFPRTTLRYANPFIAKCYIAFCSNYTINCGIIEVNQKDLTRGSERIITSISEEEVYKFSQPISPGNTKKDLTLWMYLIMK